ncbi:MAG TPA: helix-turn-helix domain-containing protein [Candidatus Bathyarchaeia archaeon]
MEALKESGGIQTRAAEKLGISERVLRYKLKKYDIRER